MLKSKIQHPIFLVFLREVLTEHDATVQIQREYLKEPSREPAQL